MQGAPSDRKRAPRRMKKSPLSRRRFMALLAGGVLAAGAPARAVTLRTPAKPPKPAQTRSAAIEKGIAEQKSFLARQLKTLRGFPLPPGSDPAFVFRPLSPRRMR